MVQSNKKERVELGMSMLKISKFHHHLSDFYFQSQIFRVKLNKMVPLPMGRVGYGPPPAVSIKRNFQSLPRVCIYALYSTVFTECIGDFKSNLS